ncbi:PilZ domain-containing protein [Thiorhodococcus mannitoliphagus]|uniref:PilZ domain-containing protein n=1 Tax=Thiorhodococcus mannitoliphagus TaxID=329406 RepID=A0A6P1E2J7_9GAMM|nr:PilZ domain-containing protein [Thiorhodococcus mannitoliphagus]
MSIESQSAPLSSSLAPDRRTQRRLSVEIPVAVTLRGLERRIRGVTKDVSWGGMLVSLAEPIPEGTRALQITLPWKRDERINAIAQVLRAKQLQDGRSLIALRFLKLSPRSHMRLEGLLATLGTSRPQQREPGSSGLVRELEVSVNDLDELRDMMEAIASGQYSCTVFESYTKDQSLCFVLAGTDEWTGIRLRARVVDVRPTTLPGYADIPLYAATLQFEHPKESLAKLIHYILGQLPESGETSTMLEWSQMVHSQLIKPLKDPTEPAPPPSKRPIKTELRSALETDFPEALNYLMLGWGDAEAFEMMFRELTLGDRFHLGGWPADAWEELMLLQDIHDRVFGITAERDKFSFLRG